MFEPGIDRVPTEMEWRRIRREVEALDEYLNARLPMPLPEPEYVPSFGERIEWFADDAWYYTKLGVRLVPYFVSLTYGAIMRDLKTTITAIIGAVVVVLNPLGIIEISPEFRDDYPHLVNRLTGIGFAARYPDGREFDGDYRHQLNLWFSR